MEHHAEHHLKIEGELVVELLDQEEFPSKIGNVVAVSDQQICLLRRDWDKLTHFRLEYLDVQDCRAIEYQEEVAYYRVVAGGIFLIAAIAALFVLFTRVDDYTTEGGPLIVAAIMLATLGMRFITSTHRHILRFEMPDEILEWHSPAVDFRYKVDAAHAVREYARKRGIFRAVAAPPA
jgi:hypothetical protein